MRKENYSYFVTDKGEPHDVGSKFLEKLPNFKSLQTELVQKLRKGNQYHFALPIEDEFEFSLKEAT